MDFFIKINLTPENKQQWEKLGWDLRACAIKEVGTFDWNDHFVDDNFGHVFHEDTGIDLFERRALGKDWRVCDMGFTTYDSAKNANIIALVFEMIKLNLMEIGEN